MPTTYAIPNGRTVFDATLYTGTGSALTVTNQYGFQPDLFWVQARNNANGYGNIQDTIRGVSRPLFSNFSNAEEAYVSGFWITAFNSNGFSVGAQNQTGASGWTYVGWQWKAGGTAVSNTSGTITSSVSANTTAGFSIVSYTGNGSSAQTVGHGLGATPSLIIVKNRVAPTGGNPNNEWCVWHSSVPTKAAYLDTADSFNSGNYAAYCFNLPNTPTSSVINVQRGGTYPSDMTNGSGNAIIAYCWTPIAGYSAFGSYTGNGSADGPFIYTGFRPKYVMFKNTTTDATPWIIFDTSRNPYNETNLSLLANTSDAEQTNNGWNVDILSNGFKIRNTSTSNNGSGNTIVYACFAENPFKYANAR